MGNRSKRKGRKSTSTESPTKDRRTLQRPRQSGLQAHKQGNTGNVIQTKQTIEASFQGPLPPPALLEQYDNIIPGLAKRIIHVAEEESEHRRASERQVISAAIEHQREIRQSFRRGQFCAASIGLAALVLTGIAICLGYPTLAGILGISPLATMAISFLRSSNQLDSQDISGDEIPTDDDDSSPIEE